MLLGPQASLGADSYHPWALCLESGLIRLVFLPILATALTAMDQWPCPGAYQWKSDTGEPLCPQLLDRAQVDAYLAGKSSPPSELPLRGDRFISWDKTHLPKPVSSETLLHP